MECVALSTLNPRIQYKVLVEISFIIKYNLAEISKSFKSLQLAEYYLFICDLVWFYGVMVRTWDSESIDPRWTLGRTWI